MIGDAALFQYKGFYAGVPLVLSLFLLSLRSAPIWIKTISANTGIALASILYLEGAREFRGLAPRSWLAYMGDVVAIGAQLPGQLDGNRPRLMSGDRSGPPSAARTPEAAITR